MKLHALMKEHFSVILYPKVIFFSFQHKLHQSTNMYNFHGSGSTVDCSGCSNPDELFDELFGYYKINNVVVVIYRRKCFFK